METNNPHKKTSGFKTPKGYFEGFEDRLFDKLRTNSSLPKDDGFKTPDGYFNSVEKTILEKVTIKQESKVISLHAYRRVIYATITIAAGFALIIYINLFNNTKNNASALDFSLIETEEITEYLAMDNGLSNIYDVVNIYNDIEFDNFSLSNDEINDEELMDYLHENTEYYEELLIDN